MSTRLASQVKPRWYQFGLREALYLVSVAASVCSLAKSGLDLLIISGCFAGAITGAAIAVTRLRVQLPGAACDHAADFQQRRGAVFDRWRQDHPSFLLHGPAMVGGAEIRRDFFLCDVSATFASRRSNRPNPAKIHAETEREVTYAFV